MLGVYPEYNHLWDLAKCGFFNVYAMMPPKALYDAMEKSIKDAKNGAPRRPAAHTLMALLSLATMAHLSNQF